MDIRNAFIEEMSVSAMAELIKALDRPASLFITVGDWEKLLNYVNESPRHDHNGPYVPIIGCKVYPYKKSYYNQKTIPQSLLGGRYDSSGS